MPRYPLRGLRVRLTVAVGASFGLLLAVSALLLYAALERHWREEVDLNLKHSSEGAYALFLADTEDNVTPRATLIHVATELVYGDRSIVGLDPDGQIIAHSRSIEDTPEFFATDLGAVDTVPVTLMTDEGPSRVVAVRLPEGFRLILGVSLGPVEERLRDLRLTLTAGFVLSLLAGTVVAFLVSGRALTPVTDVARTADRVSDALARGVVPDVVLPTPAAPDEVGRLQVAFAALVRRLDLALWREREVAANQRRFFADAAHELRTPITILRNEIETARQTADPHAPERIMLDRLQTEAEHLTNLVSDLLLLARGETAGDLRTASVLYLDDIVSRVILRAGRHPAAAGRQLTTGRFDTSAVRGDPSLLERAVMALVENALIHAPASDIEITVGAEDGRNPRRWVAVADHGPAIPPEAKEKIFERFFRVRHDVPGSGLGLAIVRWIAELHGGSLRLVQHPDQAGKAFILELPAHSQTHSGTSA